MGFRSLLFAMQKPLWREDVWAKNDRLEIVHSFQGAPQESRNLKRTRGTFPFDRFQESFDPLIDLEIALPPLVFDVMLEGA